MSENKIIRDLKPEDASGMCEWMKDQSVNRFFAIDFENSSSQKADEFIRNAEKERREKHTYHWAIVNERDEYQGTISLKHIDNKAKTAEYAIVLKRSAQGKGLAERATKEIFRIAFEEWGLNRIFLNVFSDNAHAISFYEKCGFIYEGEFREHLWVKGERRSIKWYALLKTDYMRKL